MALRQIKSKIRSVEKTRQVTKAMEAVSAVKMRKSQRRALLGRPYAESALSILERLSRSVDVVRHPLVSKRVPVKHTGVILITSDKGLAGSLNTALLKRVEEHIRREGLSKETLTFYTIGKKGYEYFLRRGYAISNSYTLGDEVDEEEVRAVLLKVVGDYMEGQIDACLLAYNNFLSTFEQEEVVRKLIPLDSVALKEVVEGITPEKGKYSEEHKESVAPIYTIEPSAEEVLDDLFPMLLSVLLFHALLEAKASEHSARMVAMKNASDKAGDMRKELRLTFNKERQAAITQEVSEIISGIQTTAK
ncbi:MAG: ATP synthase F1 subunit gamma [Candidatus Paceibacterota bacterium]